jgi:FdhD protein
VNVQARIPPDSGELIEVGSGFAGERAQGAEADACSVAAKGKLHTPAGAADLVWQVPEEVPVAILFNSISYAVMMATPADLEDFATGFALAEGLVRDPTHIKGVLVLPSREGLAADISIDDKHIVRARMAERSIEGRVGCGLCGIEDIKDAIRMPGGQVPETPLDPAAVKRAHGMLADFQPMNAVNRSVHAAAWCDHSGQILLAREDVGRHNALDKLIGALARGGADPRDGFVLVSSRCSFELVQKCALAGIGALATVSAPTALALKLARGAGLKLAALSRAGVVAFNRD